MIARIWHGRTPDCMADEYFQYIKKTGVQGYKSTEGNRAMIVLRRIKNGVSEFLLITLWDSFEAIKKFSGPDVEKAVYFPDDKKYLLELEPHVDHFEVLLASEAKNSYNGGYLPTLIKYMKGIKI
jgi:heme-degrading monooxygenase HmoA